MDSSHDQPGRLARWWRARFGVRVPLVYQTSIAECGVASLAMVLLHFGVRTSLAELWERMANGREGVTAWGIAQEARAAGLKVRAFVRMEPEQLRALPTPTLVHFGFNHFAVVEHWAPRAVRVADPGGGRRWMSLARFDEQFTGVALVFERAEPAPPPAPAPAAPWRAVVRLALAAPGAWSLLVQLTSASLLVQLVLLAFSGGTMLLFDHAVPRREGALVSALGWALLAFGLARMAALALQVRLRRALHERLDAHVTGSLLKHILGLPYAFFLLRGRGALAQQVMGGNHLLRLLSTETLSMGVEVTGLAALGAFSLWLSPRLGALVLAAAALEASWLLVRQQGRALLAMQEREAEAEATAFLLEAVQNAASVKIAGAEGRVVDLWQNLRNKYLARAAPAASSDALDQAALSSIEYFVPLLVLWLGAREVLAGQATLGAILALTVNAALILSPLRRLVGHGQVLRRVGAQAFRLQETLQTRPEQEGADALPAPALEGGLELRGVSFRHGARGEEVLRDVSFRVAPGQKVAIVGPSGAGKSTLVRLLLGLLKPTAGAILYDGADLQGLQLASVRRQVGAVLQGGGLWNRTLRHNITPDDARRPLAAVREAARRAQIDAEIMSMPQAYRTYAGEDGCNLSGGQRQRVLLARALVRDPRLLLLDEATSDLDVLTERAVAAELDALGLTQIVVAHRLPSIVNADLIVVLDRGAVVEHGTHAELCERGGLYAAMVGKKTEPELAPAMPA